MTATAYFIQDRAQTLVYEAIQFPGAAATAMAWLHRAAHWACQHGHVELAGNIRAGIAEIDRAAEARAEQEEWPWPPIDLCEYNGVRPGVDFPATLYPRSAA